MLLMLAMVLIIKRKLIVRIIYVYVYSINTYKYITFPTFSVILIYVWYIACVFSKNMYPQGVELGIPWSDNFGSSVDIKCRQDESVDNSPGGNWYIPWV